MKAIISALSYACALLLTQAQELCDLEPFLERSVDGLPPCKTCFFPRYPNVENINVSDYKLMDMSHQWFYFHGDSTLRQMWGEFYSIVHKTQPMGYAELKHQSRQQCPDQLRNSYVPPPYDARACYYNEKTCTSFYNDTGMGQAIKITWDWKHLIYEDYDRWLYNGWIQGKKGPDFLFVSPGLHDCFHDPDHYEHHARELRHLIEHLAMLLATVIYVDATPSTEGFNGNKVLMCIFYVNAAGHALAKEFGMPMFSRQTMIVSGDQKDKDGGFPVHQPDQVVGTEVRYLLAWLSCVLEHKRAGTLTARSLFG